MSKDDYELDWTGFDIGATDIIMASHIITIQDNVDLIYDNLANVSHDNSVYTSNFGTHNDDLNISHEGTEYGSHESTHLSSVYAGHNVTDRTPHDVSNYFFNLTSVLVFDYSTAKLLVNTSFYSTQYISDLATNNITHLVDHKTTNEETYNSFLKSGHDEGVYSAKLQRYDCNQYHSLVYNEVEREEL
jgi:hypothetical protein